MKNKLPTYFVFPSGSIPSHFISKAAGGLWWFLGTPSPLVQPGIFLATLPTKSDFIITKTNTLQNPLCRNMCIRKKVKETYSHRLLLTPVRPCWLSGDHPALSSGFRALA